MHFLKLFSFFLLPLFFFQCQKSIDIAVDDCSEEQIDGEPIHPQAEQFQALLDKYVNEIGFPGVTMVIYSPTDGKWVGSAGYSRLENQTPMQPCNIFHSASVAKTYHTTAAMLLQEEGRLDLDQTVASYMPKSTCADLPNLNSATVRQLMNHTSGIPDFIEADAHVLDYFHDLQREFTTQQYLEYVCGKEPNFPAGAKTEYSNTNTVLLALIMDEVAGNHANVITEKILQPLGLEHTFYKNETAYPAPTGSVNTYVDIRGDGELINSTEIERNFAAMSIGHDGMLASANDYLRFMHALLNGEIVNENSLAQMLDYQPYSASIVWGEGLGLEVTQTPLKTLTRAGHNGGSLGAANNIFHYVETNTTIAICSNFGDFLPSPLGQRFYSPLIGNRNTLMGEVEVLLFGE
ncbi:MAG: serine hydrolase domain-containing protein [Saprospiraceae bacterium]